MNNIKTISYRLPLKSKNNKFNNKITEIDRIKFKSKLEADYYIHLKHKKEKGEIEFFLMQVPFKLPGNTKFVLDFIIFKELWGTMDEHGWDIKFIEIKGKKTSMYIMKKKQVEELYDIEINEITKRSEFI